MHILIATDIWGRTPHVEDMAAQLARHAHDVTIVDPYDGADPGFRRQEDAYDHFLKECGHARYAERVAGVLPDREFPVRLVGFSAGAGAVWHASSLEDVGPAEAAACFYGSSIRTMTDRRPRIPVELVFPDHEPQFDVLETIARLRKIPMAACQTTPHGHGFMNPLSANFDSQAHARWMRWLAHWLGRRGHPARPPSMPA